MSCFLLDLYKPDPHGGYTADPKDGRVHHGTLRTARKAAREMVPEPVARTKYAPAPRVPYVMISKVVAHEEPPAVWVPSVGELGYTP